MTAVPETAAPALTLKESAQLSALKKIENRHMCQQHKKPCFIQADGEHYQLMMNDITKWAHLMVCLFCSLIICFGLSCLQAENQALLDIPPDALNLTDVIPRQHFAKKALAKSQMESSNMPEWMQQLMGMMLVGNIATNNRMLSMNSPATPTPSSIPLHYGQMPLTPLSPTLPLKRPASPFEYPMIDAWLESLEKDAVQGKKAQGYQRFHESLSANGIDDLGDLLRLTSDELMTIIPGINIGTAKRLLAFAQEDLTLREPKRFRLV